jgi:hypothetical protein
MQKLILALGLSLLFATASAFAQDSGAQLPSDGERLESSGQLALRASSPDAAFGTKGDRIGWLKDGESVRVVSSKQVSTVFGFEVWVEVSSESGAKGWIYDGMAEDVARGRGSLAKKQISILAQAN